MTAPAELDQLDRLELAELLDFTADALSWREAQVIYPDLQAHLRRWSRRLGAPVPPADGGEPLTDS